jgi:hypothetical protein
MGGQSQQRNGVQKKASPHRVNKTGGQPRAAAAEPLPAATTASPTTTATTSAATPPATPAASAPPVPAAGWLGLVRRAAPVTLCTCGLNPCRLDRNRGVKRESCHHITARVVASECQACGKTGSGGQHAAHHLGCDRSLYYGKTHAQIYEEQEAKKASKPPTAKDAQGTRKLDAFSAFKPSVAAAEEIQKKTLAYKEKEKRGHAVPVALDRDESADGGLWKRVKHAAAALGAVFYPPTPTKEAEDLKRTDGVEAQDGADRRAAAAALVAEDGLVADDELKEAKLLPALEAQIQAEMAKFPRVKADGSIEKHLAVHWSPDEFAVRFPAGSFKIYNPEDCDSSADARPSYTKSVLRGVVVYFSRHELEYPHDVEVVEALRCTSPGCDCRLKFERWSTSRPAGRYKTIFHGGSKRPSIVVEGRYKCEGCGLTFGANEPAIRLRLPPSIRGGLPVPSEHVLRGVNWYVSESLDALCEMDCVTYEGCDAISRRDEHALRVLHNRHEKDWLDQIRRYRLKHREDTRDFRVFPPFDDWLGRPVPQGATLRKRLEKAHYAVGSGGDGMSRHEANVLYQQSVTTTPEGNSGELADEAISADHTFAAAKAFYVPGQNKLWNVATGFLCVLCSLLVKTTGMNECLHALFWLVHRPGFKPKVVFTDNWPNDDAAWFAHLPFARGRLDVFHFMKRISDTLRPAHSGFQGACRSLSRCIFQYDQNDVSAVERALRDGSLNGTKLSEREAKKLVTTGKYDRYIASSTFDGPTILENIITAEASWARKWPCAVDEKTGDTLGTRGTDAALRNAEPHCESICDVEHHTLTLKPKPHQKHGLAEKKKVRGSKVEALHAVQGHFANGGMRALTAQMLTEEGGVRFTKDHQAALLYQRGQRLSPRPDHYRPWLRREANTLARAAGMPLPYPDEPVLEADTGERFLYDYYVEQLEREKKHDFTQKLSHCPCEVCAAKIQSCPCAVCDMFRRAGAAPPSGELNAWIVANTDTTKAALQAAATRTEDLQRRQQLEQLARFVTIGAWDELFTNAPRAGVDLAEIVGFTAAPTSPAAAPRALTQPTRNLAAGMLAGLATPLAPLFASPLSPQRGAKPTSDTQRHHSRVGATPTSEALQPTSAQKGATQN